MCGISGIISSNPAVVRKQTVIDMAASLAHRGPDGEGLWMNESGIAAFSHRRLCVIDTSREAGQPMHYQNRYTIVYNGEIYNYLELKADLEKRGYAFYTASDTEVILAAYAAYKDECLQHFDGMFAFAIWDELNHELFCARDRFGEKPFFFFYDSAANALFFGSELKALHAAGITKTYNHALLLRYLVLGHTSDPRNPAATFDGRIQKLPPAHTLKFSPRTMGYVMNRYWQLPAETEKYARKDAIETFRSLLFTSVSRRLRSDMPVGTSLSGGLDSSSIAAVLSALGRHDLKTFTAVFPGFEKDESVPAREVAASLGFENYSVRPSVAGLIDDFENLLLCQEEPFTSSSVYAQYKVFQLAAEHGVTVLLDGQGADETLGGYDKYRSWRYRSVFPYFTARFLERRERSAVSSNQFVDNEFIDAYKDDIIPYKPVVKTLNNLLYHDTFCMGLEELLRYADRNSMAHGREVRLPFLSHELVSFVFSLPSNLKISNGYTKYILRHTFQNSLPSSVVWNRTKTGFEPPQRQWMKHRQVKEYMHAALTTLVKEKILKARVLEMSGAAHGAYEKKAWGWRWLVAGSLMRLNKKGSE